MELPNELKGGKTVEGSQWHCCSEQGSELLVAACHTMDNKWVPDSELLTFHLATMVAAKKGKGFQIKYFKHDV